MHCLIILFDIVVVHRPSSIIHRLPPFGSRPSLVLSIRRPLSAVMSSPFLPPFLIDIVAISGLKG
jgi:hypothetical protein